jgi:hypothetical protein
MKKIKIIQCKTKVSLEHAVQKLLSDGWNLEGGVSAYKDDCDNVIYLQKLYC